MKLFLVRLLERLKSVKNVERKLKQKCTMRIIVILCIYIGCVLSVTGCASKQLILHPITDQDFALIEEGQPAPISGYIISEFYLEEVIKARLEVK